MSESGSWRAARALDAQLEQPLVVVGSLPPTGRDLDVLVDDAERAAVERALQQAGFLPRGDEWVKDGGDAVVELISADSWAVSPVVLRQLREQAQSMAGLSRLVRPAPHMTLLLLARQLPLSGALDPKRRRRALEAVDDDATAWIRAEEVAPAWRAKASLAHLRRCIESSPTRLSRVRSAAERLRADDPSRSLVLLRACRHGARPVTRDSACVIALSSLDGAGKSTQSTQLVQALSLAGYDAVVQWNRMSYDASLTRLTAPVRALVRLAGMSPVPLDPELAPPGADDPDSEFYIAPDQRAARRLRERLPWLSVVWVTLVAWMHGVALRRDVVRAVDSGRLVVRDRYVLDSVVHLEDRYGSIHSVRAQRWLLRRLAPRPLAAFLLDVPPREAYARKPEEHTIAALERHRLLYLHEAAAMGVQVLDGCRPADEVAADLAQHVLRSFGQHG